MGLWRRLFAQFGLMAETPGDERRDLACLLATSVRTYSQEHLAAADPAGELPAEVQEEVVRIYWTFVESVGVSDEARDIFCHEVARIVANGDRAGIERAVRNAEALGPPSVKPA